MRRGLTLVEVLLAASILAVGAATVFNLIQWNARVTLASSRRELARSLASSSLARLSGRPFSELSARYGPTATRREDPLADPVVRQAVQFVESNASTRGFEGRADFRDLSDGSGFLQVSVTYSASSSTRESISLNRLLPSPSLSGIALDSGRDSLVKRAVTPLSRPDGQWDPLTRANDKLFLSLLPRLSTNSAARFLDQIMSFDRSDRKYDIDWAKSVDLTAAIPDQWAHLERLLTTEEIPDGIYDVDTLTFLDSGVQVDRSDRAAQITVYRLRNVSDKEYFLLRLDYTDDRLPSMRLGKTGGRDLGEVCVARVFEDNQFNEPKDRLTGSVLAIRKRLFLICDRFRHGGRRIPFLRRMGIFTSQELLDPLAVSRPLMTFLDRTSRMMGLQFAGRRIDPVRAQVDELLD